MPRLVPERARAHRLGGLDRCPVRRAPRLRGCVSGNTWSGAPLLPLRSRPVSPLRSLPGLHRAAPSQLLATAFVDWAASAEKRLGAIAARVAIPIASVVTGRVAARTRPTMRRFPIAALSRGVERRHRGSRRSRSRGSPRARRVLAKRYSGSPSGTSGSGRPVQVPCRQLPSAARTLVLSAPGDALTHHQAGGRISALG